MLAVETDNADAWLGVNYDDPNLMLSLTGVLEKGGWIGVRVAGRSYDTTFVLPPEDDNFTTLTHVYDCMAQLSRRLEKRLESK